MSRSKFWSTLALATVAYVTGRLSGYSEGRAFGYGAGEAAGRLRGAVDTLRAVSEARR